MSTRAAAASARNRGATAESARASCKRSGPFCVVFPQLDVVGAGLCAGAGRRRDPDRQRQKMRGRRLGLAQRSPSPPGTSARTPRPPPPADFVGGLVVGGFGNPASVPILANGSRAATRRFLTDGEMNARARISPYRADVSHAAIVASRHCSETHQGRCWPRIVSANVAWLMTVWTIQRRLALAALGTLGGRLAIFGGGPARPRRSTIRSWAALGFNGPTARETSARFYWNPAALGAGAGRADHGCGHHHPRGPRPRSGVAASTLPAFRCRRRPLTTSTHPLQWPPGPGAFLAISTDVGGGPVHPGLRDVRALRRAEITSR